jgi:hypothetical protein
MICLAAKRRLLTPVPHLPLLRHISFARIARCIKSYEPLLSIKELVKEYGRWTMKLEV